MSIAVKSPLQARGPLLNLWRPRPEHYWTDSGIDTDEELDISETGINCDADATTAIPAGSIIKIENELCLVTATGTTLTVERGYGSSTAATHTTNQDIYRLDRGGCVLWLPGQDDAYSSTIRDRSGNGNHGTIYGATWVRLPSGLWSLSFDGTDDSVGCGSSASILGLTSGTVLIWLKLDGYFASASDKDTSAVNEIQFRANAGANNWLEYLTFKAGALTQQLRSPASSLDTTKWNLLGISSSGTAISLNINGVDQTVTVILGGNTGDFFGDVANLDNFTLGGIFRESILVGDFTGYSILHRIFNSALTATQMLGIFNQERHLFGR